MKWVGVAMHYYTEETAHLVVYNATELFILHVTLNADTVANIILYSIAYIHKQYFKIHLYISSYAFACNFAR